MDQFDELLDDVEKKVEEHRAKLLAALKDQEEINVLMDTISNSSEEHQSLTEVDKEDIKAKISRLKKRLDTVQIQVKVCRDECQVDALAKVEMQLSELVTKVESNAPDALTVAQSYLNACSQGTGSRFEALLLSCTSDDQKVIKAKITNILEALEILELQNE